MKKKLSPSPLLIDLHSACCDLAPVHHQSVAVTFAQDGQRLDGPRFEGTSCYRRGHHHASVI